MQRISRIMLATLMITSLKTHTSLPDHAAMDAVLAGCTQSDNYAQCFTLCGMMHDALTPLLAELDELKSTLEEEMIQADVHENDAKKESIEKDLDAIAKKKQLYLESLQRCFTSKSSCIINNLTNYSTTNNQVPYDAARDVSQSTNVLN